MNQWIKRIIVPPLNLPLPVYDRERITKGVIPFASLWQREVRRDFIKFFQTAKVIRNDKFEKILTLSF